MPRTATNPTRRVDPIARAWGDEIKIRRRDAYTQAELAFECGVHQTTISQVERGVLIPSPRLQRQLCRVLGLDPHTVYRLVRGTDAA
jgi:DNA-binding XRE family transcriptional regulator